MTEIANYERDREALKAAVEEWKSLEVDGSLEQGHLPPEQRCYEFFRAFAKPVLDDVVRLSDSAESLSLPAVARLQKAAEQITKLLKAMVDAEVAANGEAMQTSRSRLQRSIARTVDAVIPLVERAKGELAGARYDSQVRLLAEGGKLLEELRSEKLAVEELMDTVESMVKSVQDAAELQGITRQGKEFHRAAREHWLASLGWAIGAVVLAGTLLWSVFEITRLGQPPPRPEESWTVAANLSHYAARALVVSLLSFLMVVCVRNFRAAKHNQVLNRHRWGALMTFREFKAAAENGAVEDAVLLHATEAVFSTQASGYDDGRVGGTHVSEVLAALKNTKK